jgi:hypothetical protein
LQTPKRSPAIRPNVVTASEAYARAQMSRDNMRNMHNLSFENDAKSFSFDPDLHLAPQMHPKTNGINGGAEHGEILRSKSTNNASISSMVILIFKIYSSLISSGNLLPSLIWRAMRVLNQFI